MKKLIAILSIAFIPALCFARIGETEAEFEGRNGQGAKLPVDQNTPEFWKAYQDGLHYDKLGVTVFYRLGKVAAEMHNPHQR
jgi:hypothetical protein